MYSGPSVLQSLFLRSPIAIRILNFVPKYRFCVSLYLRFKTTCHKTVSGKNLKFRNKFKFTNHLGNHCFSMLQITRGLKLSLFKKTTPYFQGVLGGLKIEGPLYIQAEPCLFVFSNLSQCLYVLSNISRC